MRRRPKFKRIMTPPPMKHIVVVTLIFFIITSIISVVIINNGIKPVLMDIAKTRTEQLANMAIGIAVNKKMAEDLDVDNLIEFEKDEDGNIVHYSFNTVVENRVQRNILNRVENYLNLLEDGVVPDPGVPLDVSTDPESNPSKEEIQKSKDLLQIPIGQVLGIPLLGSLGPKVPVNLDVLGFVSTEVDDKLVEWGYNNAYIIVFVRIKVELSVVIPFASEPISIEQSIPISRTGITGEVPDYIGGNDGEDPTLSIPMDSLKEQTE
ncbi:sporulation protein YunB [Aquibacillus sp. 3ASR75-11]|uniref:Sporulation protein YunB n=1 Tax=Terrihalobacillus insolitus TaxID=2950438 RepID=A0A9X3WSE4_9BACI|nr:sporulation protein YunB [Terrihalobacillus insolitus]MDC3412351.1 sporulation protein YunB [Terrihalobacillus insolitus]MDC3422956.1 sporulation protein YunB [Terrihalobacillus insolitus]